MALADLIRTRNSGIKIAQPEIDKEQVKDNIDIYRHLIAYWRKYPDKFIDYMCSLNPDNTFHFYTVQRMYLRICMRYKTTYAVFSRGFSKSFLAVMAMIIKCILYPGCSIAEVADQKGQSASILQNKMEEIFRLIPALRQEIRWDTKGHLDKTMATKDAVAYSFKCGSKLSNAAIGEQTRGQRFQSLCIEEVCTIDEDKLTQIILPTLTVSRKVGKDGKHDPNEVLNQSTIYVTSAGYKGTFAYDKLINTLCHMVADKHNNDAFILGGDWRVPVVEGLQPSSFIYDQSDDQTMTEDAFNREYGSIWSGTLDGAYFNLNKFDSNRILNIAEEKYNNTISKRGYYVMGVDVGRRGDLTEVVIIKVTPSGNNFIKQIVNIYTYEAEHFEKQAIHLKRLFNRYHCDIAVVDANGIGLGLVDFLVRDQVDPDTGDTLFNWGVYNDDDRAYKEWETPDTIHNALYVMKANVPLNTEMYSYCQSQLNNDRLKFLIDENTAKNRLMALEKGKKMTSLQREVYLMPYVETSILKSQMANLIQENEGANILLKRSNERIHKDKFSALIYGLYWVMLQEKKNQNRKRLDLSKLALFTAAKR